ncbi:MAG: SMC-Scp complex subunit ScpB [Marmoricola sp.]
MSEQEVDDSQTLAVPLAELRPALEALLLVADEPMDDAQLASVVGYPVEDVSAALRSLAQEYDDQQRGFELRSVGWGLALLHP